VDLGQQMRPIDLQTIRLSNYRAIYNVCVGLVLRIPYRGSVTRLPARRALWELGRSLDAVLEARERMGLSHELDAQYRQAVERLRGRRQVGVQLPVMLTYLLRKIGRLEDFPAALLELRERMAGLRSRRKEIEAVINGTADSAGADAQLDQLLAAFSDDVSAASIALGAGVPVTAATAGAVVAASSGPPGWLIGGLAAAAAAGGYARPLSSLWRRIRHRDLEIVRDIGQTTRTFLDARGRIESLWSFDTSRYDYEERFDRMAALQVL
ncbi:MAG TPA: hypothetical protein VHG08_22510, partial [Longimicrobium sp.]|nr:hypothetical protein [Longimicrobium sp.]